MRVQDLVSNFSPHNSYSGRGGIYYVRSNLVVTLGPDDPVGMQLIQGDCQVCVMSWLTGLVAHCHPIILSFMCIQRPTSSSGL